MQRQGRADRQLWAAVGSPTPLLSGSCGVGFAGHGGSASVAGLTFVGRKETIGCGCVCIVPSNMIVTGKDGPVVIPQTLVAAVLDEAVEQRRMEAWIITEVERGEKLPGLYPMNDETTARYAA